MNSSKLMVKPGSRLKLADRDPDNTHGHTKEKAARELAAHGSKMGDLQELLYAEKKHALLIVLQALDAGGKDGTIRHVMSGVNPQSCDVTSFKAPTAEELGHDFLWRVHKAVPINGTIGIFNRSHYEDVLVVRVHNLVPQAVWSKRYQQINDFERMLTENRVHVVKFLLYISKEEQAKRFRARLEDKTKSWKFSEADVKERGYWDQYIEAYNDALRRCSTPQAPWYVIPANKKWFRNVAVSEILIHTLEGLKMKFPKAPADLSHIQFE